MCASTRDFAGTGNDDADDGTGLSGLHAYSLLAAYELKKVGSKYELLKPGDPKGGNVIKLVKIRNPWGTGEWKGAWNDNDSKWNPTLMKQVGHRKADDGIFFMPFADFKEFFDNYTITYYNPKNIYCAQQYTSLPSKDTTINFEVTTAGEYFFSIHQVNSRHFPKKDKYCYTTVKLVISQIVNGKSKYVGMCQKADKEMFFKANCQPGKYVAVVEAKWRRKVNQFVFSSYGPGNINIGEHKETKVPDTFM